MGDLQAALSATNLWWRSGEWQRDDPDLRAAGDAPFDYRPGVLAGLVPGGLYVLRGPRRIGKSTELKRAVAEILSAGVERRRVIHCSVDGWRARDLAQLVRAAGVFLMPPEQGPRYWFIDEISSVQGDWPSQIKWLRDNDAGFRQDTVVLTGSSAALLDEATKALAGRRGPATRTDRVLLPMRFTDFCRMTRLADPPHVRPLRARELRDESAAVAVRELAPWTADLVAAWEAYLHVGGFPEAVASWARDRQVAPSLLDALWHVIHGEAITGREFSGAQTFALLARLARNLCSPVNVSSIAADIDVARTTTDSRIRDLVRAYLLWPVHRADGLTPNLRAQAKYYFTDPLLARLASERGGSRAPDLTQLSEQQVGMALLRNAEQTDAQGLATYDRILHYRSATGREIDFVGRDLGPVAVESKYTDATWGRELQTIKSSPWAGVLATRSGVDIGPTASVLPAPVLVLLLAA